jgi:L-aspartate oxidase
MDENKEVAIDVLIIGAGIAGATAAVRLADNPKVNVTVLTDSKDPHESGTFYAQGGIIFRGPEDSAGLLTEDLLRAGAYFNNPQAVRILAQKGPRVLQKVLIEKMGVAFNETTTDTLEYIREAAHSTDRILHVADATGRAIEEKAIEALKRYPNINFLSQCTAVDLLTPGHHSRDPLAIYEPPSCVGAYVFDQKRGKVVIMLAKKTILATGGLGQIYLHTTNPPNSRGDGLAMAYRAGARVINAEYVQFHPTAFYDKDAARFLISEAVRGEGGRLVNDRGEPFMQKYDPEWKDLAPRDVVARSIHREMLVTQAPCVYLDLRSYIPEHEIRQRFPNILQNCLEYGIDITKDLIPVVPASHYFCGGVWVDGQGRTSLKNLYAVGEVSCTGVHGANRLGSASLLEGLVWGWRAGKDILRQISKETLGVKPEDIPPWQDVEQPRAADPMLILQDMTSIKNIMWSYVGLVRSTRRLERAIDDLQHLNTEIDKFYRATRLTDGLIGLRNSAQAALIVARSAWENKISRGCHYRED